MVRGKSRQIHPDTKTRAVHPGTFGSFFRLLIVNLLNPSVEVR